jgi:beta-galactosidase
MGRVVFAKCAILLNEQFERVFFKNDYSVAIAILNIYMVRNLTTYEQI